MTPKEIEDGLTSWSIYSRWESARRTDYTPTPEQFERGLKDSTWEVRLAFAKRADFTPTPAQIKRGLTDKYWEIRELFECRQTEWQARWEAEELKKRHASVVESKSKLEAL